MYTKYTYNIIHMHTHALHTHNHTVHIQTYVCIQVHEHVSIRTHTHTHTHTHIHTHTHTHTHIQSICIATYVRTYVCTLSKHDLYNAIIRILINYCWHTDISYIAIKIKKNENFFLVMGNGWHLSLQKGC